MQVTIDSRDPIEKALQVVGSLYGVELTVAEAPAPAAAAVAPAPRATRRPAKKTAKKAAKKTAKKAAKKATAVSAPSRPRRRRTIRSTEDLNVIRAWARDNGFNVSDRGRVSNAVLAAYEAANPAS